MRIASLVEVKGDRIEVIGFHAGEATPTKLTRQGLPSGARWPTVTGSARSRVERLFVSFVERAIKELAEGKPLVIAVLLPGLEDLGGLFIVEF